MALRTDLKKFWNNHPFLTIAFGATGIYLASETYRAAVAGKGDFWGKGIFGLGMTTSTSTTTSSSHSPIMREDAGETSIHIPENMFGIGQPPRQMVQPSPEDPLPAAGMYGYSGRMATMTEPDTDSPMPSSGLYGGLPNGMRRRVLHGQAESAVMPDDYAANPFTEAPAQEDRVANVMGLDGVMPLAAGTGWL